MDSVCGGRITNFFEVIMAAKKAGKVSFLDPVKKVFKIKVPVEDVEQPTVNVFTLPKEE
jgi:hypothetical protein